MKYLFVILFLIGCYESVEEQQCRHDREDKEQCESELHNYREHCNLDESCSFEDLYVCERRVNNITNLLIESRNHLSICEEELYSYSSALPEGGSNE